jgi:hypothetical protein
VLFLEGGVEATVDYWHYDFDNVIGSMPYDAITSLYASDDAATRAAVSPFIICPGGRASDLAPADQCIAQNLQRIQIDLVNWPGLTTSGVDTHFAARTDAGPGQLSLTWDSTYTLGYDTKELLLEGTDLTLYAEREPPATSTSPIRSRCRCRAGRAAGRPPTAGTTTRSPAT